MKTRLGLGELGRIGFTVVRRELSAGAERGAYPTPEELTVTVGKHILGSLLHACSSAPSERAPKKSIDDAIETEGTEL